MRRLVVGIALGFATVAGGVAGAGVASATDQPAADDWPVSRTYVNRMYVDDAAATAAGYAGCAVGYGYYSRLSDYCAA